MADLPLMNPTTPTHLDYAIPEFWERELIIEAEKKMFWKHFEGPQGSGMPVIRKDDLTKEPGDQIHVQTLSNLTGSGVSGDTVMTGQEESLRLGQITVTPTFKRHAVSVNKPARQKANFDTKTAAKGRLAYWLADYIDTQIFTQAVTGRTHRQYGNSKLNYGSLTTGDEMGLAEVSKAKAALKFNKALPIQVNENYSLFCGVMHSYDAYYLQQDTSTQNWSDYQKYADNRGELNRLFTGALGVLDGVILKEADNVSYASSKTKSVFFGGEAMADGYSQLPDWIEQVQDYEYLWGVSTSVSFGTANAVQANIVEVDCYAAQPYV